MMISISYDLWEWMKTVWTISGNLFEFDFVKDILGLSPASALESNLKNKKPNTPLGDYGRSHSLAVSGKFGCRNHEGKNWAKLCQSRNE